LLILDEGDDEATVGLPDATALVEQRDALAVEGERLEIRAGDDSAATIDQTLDVRHGPGSYCRVMVELGIPHEPAACQTSDLWSTASSGYAVEPNT
jgi:hypothetical protein